MREERKDESTRTNDNDGGIDVFTCNWATMEVSRVTVN